jgi:hypothetical protein
MKRLFMLLAIATLALQACQKSSDYITPIFPGYTGAGDAASWVISRHTITDAAYLNAVLPTLTPPTTLRAFDSLLVVAREKEVSPYSYRLYKNGEVAITGKNVTNQPVWVIQGDLKWEPVGDFVYISKKVTGSWVKIIEAYPDLDKLVFKFTRAYFGDNSINRERFFMDALYSMYQLP